MFGKVEDARRNRRKRDAHWSPSIMADQRPKPIAACTRCGAVSYYANLINGPCGRWVADQRCDGINGSASRSTDWDECLDCAGSGTSDGARCGQCDGSGWLCVRDRRRDDPDALDEYLKKRKVR